MPKEIKKPKKEKREKGKLYKYLRPDNTPKTKVRIDMGNGVIHTVPELEKIKKLIKKQHVKR